MDTSSITLIKQIREKINLELRRLTYMLRSKPNMLIIGAQKAGTTSLYKYLENHPNTGASYRKEPRFYTHNQDKGLMWYRGNFPLLNLNSEHKVVFEASPSYIFFPHVAQQVARDFPNIKVIALLRNPIHRAYSQYEMNVRHPGLQEDRSFDEVVKQELEQLADDPNLVEHIDHSKMQSFYLTRGHYWQQLERWYAVLPRENVKVIQSENFFENTLEVYCEVLDFLDLSPIVNQEFSVWNASNNSQKYREKINPETYSLLLDHFKPHNDLLFQNLGQSFDWD